MNDDRFSAQDADPLGPLPGDPVPPSDPGEPEPKGALPPLGADSGEAEAEPAEDPRLPADPVQDPDPDPSAAAGGDAEDELARVRRELNELRGRLSRQEAFFARADRECEEFRTLYPDVSLSTLPDSVWKSVGDGIPIAAAYALAERRRVHSEELAQASNAENRRRSPGALSPAADDYFTPAEVRAMTPAEVRSNYQKIMQSMQKWH